MCGSPPRKTLNRLAWRASSVGEREDAAGSLSFLGSAGPFQPGEQTRSPKSDPGKVRNPGPLCTSAGGAADETDEAPSGRFNAGRGESHVPAKSLSPHRRYVRGIVTRPPRDFKQNPACNTSVTIAARLPTEPARQRRQPLGSSICPATFPARPCTPERRSRPRPPGLNPPAVAPHAPKRGTTRRRHLR